METNLETPSFANSHTPWFLLPVPLLLNSSIALHAQVVGGSISGSISDASGAKISGASVRVVNSETGTERRLVTDRDGRYAAPSISVGTYNIIVSDAGFGTKERKGV